MKLRSFNRLFPEAFQSIRRNAVMSIASIVTIALTLFVCGVFAIIVLNLSSLSREIESTVEIQAFMDENITATETSDLKADIMSLSGVVSLEFVSKEDGLENMAKRLGQTVPELEASLGGNPLPDSYLVQVASADDVAPVAELLADMPLISEVQYGEGVVDKMFSILKWVRYFGVGIIAFLIVASIIIVAFNIKMTVANRKWEIIIMRYVGASNWYIRWPFCIAGMLMGLIGAIIAVGILYLSYSLVINYVNDILVFSNLVSGTGQLLYLYGGMLLLGLILGSAGSLISLNVYLKERNK